MLVDAAPFDLQLVTIGSVRAAVEHDSSLVGNWLTSEERVRYNALRVDKRRFDWLAGRVAAKQCCRIRHGLRGEDAFHAIEIVALTEGPERGRPTYRVGGVQGPYCLTISHSGDIAIAALARDEGVRLGVDVEHIEPREPGFEAIALAASEIAALGLLATDQRARAVTQIWALKEAVTKALGCGLRIDLANIVVALHPGTGEPVLGDAPFQVVVPANIGAYRSARAGLQALDGAVLAWVSLD